MAHSWSLCLQFSQGVLFQHDYVRQHPGQHSASWTSTAGTTVVTLVKKTPKNLYSQKQITEKSESYSKITPTCSVIPPDYLWKAGSNIPHHSKQRLAHWRVLSNIPMVERKEQLQCLFDCNENSFFSLKIPKKKILKEDLRGLRWNSEIIPWPWSPWEPAVLNLWPWSSITLQ